MAHSRRALVVEDSKDGREALSELLAVWGFDVSAAADGKQALEIALARPLDFIVMDLSLPDGDACAVIRRVRKHANPVRIIAYSGWHHLRGAALEAGADVFVLKPDVDALEWLLSERVAEDVARTGPASSPPRRGSAA